MILITGGTGLVGGHLTLRLLEKEEQVKLLIRNDESKEKLKKTFSFYASAPEILLNKIEWAYGDVTDLFSLYEAMCNVERVYHCAAKVSFDRQHKKEMMDTNIRGTFNVVNVCLGFGIKKLLHVSSIAAIKNSAGGEIITENNQWPTGNSLTYAYSKAQAEFEVWRGIHEGLQAAIVNPSVILGPGDWTCGSPRFFSVVNKGLNYYTHGITGFVDVLDVVDQMIMLMDSNIQAERFILNSENLSYEELFNLIADALGAKKPRHIATRRLTEIAWRADWLKSKLFFTRPMLSKDSARASQSRQLYTSEKIKLQLGCSYIPVSESIHRIANQFLKERAFKN